MITVIGGTHVHKCDVCHKEMGDGETFWHSFPREGEEENYKANLGDWGPLETGYIVCSRHQPNYNDGWWDDYRQDKETKMKALVVGRHSDAEYGNEAVVMGNENITFPAKSEDIDLASLYRKAKELGASMVIFQAMPSQLAARLAYESRLNGDAGQEIEVWGVVNTPRPDLRQAPTVEEFEFDSIHDQTMAWVAIQKANPRAKIEEVRPGRIRMTVDAPMPFKFSHLERIL